MSSEATPERVVLPKPEKVPLSKLMEAVLPYQSGIYVTVLNIIQCITLAFLIVEVREAVSKDELGLKCMGRALLALAIILVIWHRYTAEMQYLWQITWTDTVGPFSMGLIECVIVFLINDTKVSLIWFVGSILFLQIFAIETYVDAYLRRKDKVTERLYKEFYKDFPIFAEYLILFLRLYDWWSIKFMMRFGFIPVSVFFLLVWLFPALEFFDITFSLTCVLSMLIGENLRGFHRFLREDPVLGPCFTRGDE